MEDSTVNQLEISKDEKTWGMLSHLSVFIGFIIPFGNIIAPLVIWLVKKDEMKFVDDQAKEALNFQISITIYIFISIVLILLLIGIPLLIAVGLFDLIVTIMAAIKANEGIKYRYPLAIRLVK